MSLLEVADLRKHHPLPRRGWFRRDQPLPVPALDGVSFRLARGEALGVVGESGSGKSTLAGLVARLADPTAGTIRFDGQDIGAVPARRAAKALWRADIQMVFQDAHDSLDPRRTAAEAVAAPLVRLKHLRGTALDQRVAWALDRVHFPASLAGRLPHHLSGGQLARVAIARAVALEPQLLILDEPTSALDVSIQATILKLLDELRRDLGLAMLFVSHDLNVVRMLCHRVLVIHRGHIVETGTVEDVFTKPEHTYTRRLVASIPALQSFAPPGSADRRLRP